RSRPHEVRRRGDRRRRDDAHRAGRVRGRGDGHRPARAHRRGGGRASRPSPRVGRALPPGTIGPPRRGPERLRLGRRRSRHGADAGDDPAGARGTRTGGHGRTDRVHPGGHEDGEPHRRASRRHRGRGLDHEGRCRGHRSTDGGDPVTRSVASIVGAELRSDGTGVRLVSPNPARVDEIVTEALLGDAETFADACRVAKAAQPAWAATPPPVRGRAVQQIGRLVEDNKEALARLITREIGKPYRESLGEVQEVIDTCNFFLSEGRRLYGQTVPSEMPDKQLFTFRAPIGVAAIITAGNFPVAVPSCYLIPALVCGDSVVWKAAEYTPATAEAFSQLI